MMRLGRVFIFLGIYLSVFTMAFPQNNKADSLIQLLSQQKTDTSKCLLLNDIARVYLAVSDFEKAMDYSKEQLELAEKIDFKRSAISANNNIGLVHFYRGNYLKCLEYYYKALKLAEETNSKVKACKILANIQSVHYELNDYTKALNVGLEVLEKAKALHDSATIAATYSQIGLVFKHKAEESKDSLVKKQLLSKALGNFYKAVLIDSLLGNIQNMSSYLTNIGLLYESTKEFDKALDYHLYSFRVKRKIGDLHGLGISYGNLGGFYLRQGNLKAADTNLHRALRISEEIGDMESKMSMSFGLSELYKKQADWKNAMMHYERYIVLRDSIANGEHTKERLEIEINYEYDKKETLLKAAAQKEKEKQQLITYSVCIGLLLVLIFAGFMYNRFKVTQRQKKLIELKEQETQAQKDLVEEKNEEIISSIRYAKRIQQSLLPNDKYIAKNLDRLK